MRLLHTESSCGWGGQEIRILSEAEAFMSLGHEVHLACPLEAPIYQEALKRDIPVTALPIERKTFKGLWRLWRWLSKQSFDVINTHSSTDAWLVALSRLLMRSNRYVVRTRHVSAPIKATWINRWLYSRGCDFVVTTGEKLRHYVIEQARLSPNRVKSVPTGVDLSRFQVGDKTRARQQCQLPADKFIMGIIATIRTWKGHIYLIEALAKLNNPNVLLVIVGDGPNRSNVESAIRKHKLESQVLLVGQQSDVVPWLQALDAFALPSYANEGVPQSLMQAMACGIPVISTPVGSIEELIEHQKTGLLVEPQSTESLLIALQTMLNNPQANQLLAERAKEHVHHHFSKQSMITQMQQVFSR